MSVPDWYAATREYREQEFNPADDGTTRGEAPDHIIRLVRAAYEEGRRLEARRYFGDTLAEGNSA